MTKDMKGGFPLYCKVFGDERKRKCVKKRAKIFSGLLKMEFSVVGY